MVRIMNTGLAFILGLGLCVAATLPAAAQNSVDGTKPELIEGILKGFGIARLETDRQGDPMINGRADGQAYRLYFYGCTDNENCRSVQFWTYWGEEVPLERVNEWNRETRYGKLYIDSDDDLILEYDVNLRHGIDERTMEDNADLWMSLIARVKSGVLSR